MSKQIPQDPFPNGKPNQDLLQNLSYVYQANIYLNSLGLGKTKPAFPEAGPGPSTIASAKAENANCTSDKKRSKKSKTDGTGTALDAVARRANRGYKYAARHSMLKTDPSIKRTFCGKCYTVLIPSVTSQTRIKGGKKVSHRVVTTCMTCCKPSSILAPPHQSPICTSSAKSDHISADVSLGNGTATQAEGVAPTASTQSVPSSKPMTPLDGPIRSHRRSKLAKPVPFWTRPDHVVIPLDQLGRSGPYSGTGVKEEKANGRKRPEKVQGVQKQGKAGKGKMEVEASQQSGREKLGEKDRQDKSVQTSQATRLPIVAKTSKAAATSTAVSADMDEEEMMNMS